LLSLKVGLSVCTAFIDAGEESRVTASGESIEVTLRDGEEMSDSGRLVCDEVGVTRCEVDAELGEEVYAEALEGGVVKEVPLDGTFNGTAGDCWTSDQSVNRVAPRSQPAGKRCAGK
jgi:hypothetical protein